MFLKLREAAKADSRGVSLSGFHDRLLGGGVLPIGFHRQSILGGEMATPSALLQ